MAEAMALGKPVIGTNYSGNTDFLSERTGFPVSFTLGLFKTAITFSDGQSWAEPDITSAADAMLQVFRNPAEREVRAASGKAFVDAHYGRANVGGSRHGGSRYSRDPPVTGSCRLIAQALAKRLDALEAL